MALHAATASALHDHLEFPRGLGALPGSPHTGAAGGAACGDLIRISVQVRDDRVVAAGFQAHGCAAARAAGSAVVELVEGESVLAAAAVTPAAVALELGGLSPAATHAAALAADALHRAMGTAARDGDVALRPVANRTLVAMSGGVDSAAAAQLALDGGEDVLAVTLELWSDPGTDGEKSCCSPQAVTGARALAHRMGIPHFTLDLRDRFRSDVVDDFLEGYAEGVTPNPCVRCNGMVRFDAMLELAGRLGAARLDTGHYARIADDGHGPLVRAGADPAKDQSYVLARLTPEELGRLRFPLGELAKPRVRDLAEAAGLPVARKAESQDLCFLAGSSGPEFMQRHGADQESEGAIVDRAGNGSAAIAATIASRSASVAESALPAPSRCTCWPRTRAPTAWWWAAAPSWACGRSRLLRSCFTGRPGGPRACAFVTTPQPCHVPSPTGRASTSIARWFDPHPVRPRRSWMATWS